MMSIEVYNLHSKDFFECVTSAFAKLQEKGLVSSEKKIWKVQAHV